MSTQVDPFRDYRTDSPRHHVVETEPGGELQISAWDRFDEQSLCDFQPVARAVIEIAEGADWLVVGCRRANRPGTIRQAAAKFTGATKHALAI